MDGHDWGEGREENENKEGKERRRSGNLETFFFFWPVRLHT